MRTSATNVRLRKLLSGITSKSLVINPEFQRRLVWSNKHKLAFIQTVLESLPFPEIYIAAGSVDLDSGEGDEVVVDGQQRLSTLYQYFTGSKEIKYSESVLPYSDLQENEKENFLEYEVVVRDLGKLDLDTIREVFKRINSTNYSLNAMEVHNSRYDGKIKKFAEKLSENEFFELNNVFTNNDIKRMKDISFVLTIIISSISTYFNLEDDFEEYLERFNDEFPFSEEFDFRFSTILELIANLNFESNSRAFKKTDLFSLIIELDRALFKNKCKIDSKKLEINLKEFYRKVDSDDERKEDILEYYKAVIQATNNRSSRIKRGEVISNIIKNSLD